jgi:hypothetical protein
MLDELYEFDVRVEVGITQVHQVRARTARAASSIVAGRVMEQYPEARSVKFANITRLQEDACG